LLTRGGFSLSGERAVADEGEARTRARTGTRTWPVGGVRPTWGAAWPRADFVVPERNREWAIAEVGPGRLLPWFAVAFGAGIVRYFTAEREPAWWAASALAAAGAIAAVLLRRHPIAFVLGLGFFAIAAGFAVATLKILLIDHPVLRYPAYSVSIAGFVELREESQKTDRFALGVERIDGTRIAGKPQRVRLSVRRGTAPPAGAFVEVKAQLNPPLQPLRPGSYDFARDLYFQRIGASGFVHGAVKIVTPPTEASVRMRANAFIQGLRDAIDARIRSVVRGDTGSLASMLITGKRDAIAAHFMTRCSFPASGMCSRSPAITWRSSPASCFSSCVRCWR
jgi:competence protein ComEC